MNDLQIYPHLMLIFIAIYVIHLFDQVDLCQAVFCMF